jgi:DNA-binding NarL/FixJ family response regulator
MKPWNGFSADGAAFDAVILDIIMPGMNGRRDAFSSLMELRSVARIVLSSGYTPIGTARALWDAGPWPSCKSLSRSQSS